MDALLSSSASEGHCGWKPLSRMMRAQTAE